MRTLTTIDPPAGARGPWEKDTPGSAPAAVRAAPQWLRETELPEPSRQSLSPETVVCECLQIRLGTLQSCIARGCASVEALAAETGATTVCGGCTPQVAALVNEESGGPVRLVAVREVLPGVRSFRFEAMDPTRNPLRTFRPGQHVVVSGMIAARWISRPYTLTSPAGDDSFFEITVKLEPDGLLSPWLFMRGPEFNAIHLSAPQGEFCVDLDRPEPVIFLVAGIGVTPAIAAARSIAAASSDKPLHIDYSARSWNDFAFREELTRLAMSHPNITVRFRATGTPGERMEAEDVRRYRRFYRKASYYICGPADYEEALRRHLRRAGVPSERVLVESFQLSARAASARAAAVPERARSRAESTAIRVVGLILLVAYLAQGGLEWSWGALEGLQGQESYRRWSGAVLLSYLAVQWLLPALRLAGRLPAAAAAYSWHRWMGALAPAFFYAHAMRVGYGYLFVLSSVYLANVLVGLMDRTVVRGAEARERYGRLWLASHIVLACLTVGLALLHVLLVFAFR